MKKGIFLVLIFSLLALLFVSPVSAENTGPPGLVLSEGIAVSSVDSEIIGEVSAIPMVSAAVSVAENQQVMKTATTAPSVSSVRYKEYVDKSIMLAALMSCAILALVSYLRATHNMIHFDLRDRKQPMPMDQTAFA